MRSTVAIIALTASFASSLAFPCFAQKPGQSDFNSALHVGAAVVDVTPKQFPVYVNGGFLAKQVSEVTTKVNARAIVLRGDEEQIGLVVVDSCMIPKWLIDDVKQEWHSKRI